MDLEQRKTRSSCCVGVFVACVALALLCLFFVFGVGFMRTVVTAYATANEILDERTALHRRTTNGGIGRRLMSCETDPSLVLAPRGTDVSPSKT